jgi:uncharacterized membrane protein
MFGDAVIGPAVAMFSLMPAVVLTSKLVPKGYVCVSVCVQVSVCVGYMQAGCEHLFCLCMWLHVAVCVCVLCDSKP